MTDPTADPDILEPYAAPDGGELMLEGFAPDPGARNGAAVIFVHGGGWNSGARQQFAWHAREAARHGYFGCTIDYRPSTTAVFPAALKDCQAAVRWTRRHADRLGIRPNRVGAFGSSAGGHLVACLGVMEDVTGGISSRVNCVVDVHGVHDFCALLKDYGEVRESVEAFLGGPIESHRDAAEAASPALHVNEGSAPLLLTHAPDEQTVPFVQTRLLAEAMLVAGRPIQVMPTPGSGHGFVYAPGCWWTKQVMAAAFHWLAQHLLEQ